MNFYIYQWSGLNDLIAITAKPNSDALPCPDGAHQWHLRREMNEREILEGRLSVPEVHEQIDRYGYCLLNCEMKASTETPST